MLRISPCFLVYVAPGRKRGREATSAEAAAVEASAIENVVVEAAPSQRPRKRALFVLSEGEDVDVPPVVERGAPTVTVSISPFFLVTPSFSKPCPLPLYLIIWLF